MLRVGSTRKTALRSKTQAAAEVVTRFLFLRVNFSAYTKRFFKTHGSARLIESSCNNISDLSYCTDGYGVKSIRSVGPANVYWARPPRR